MNTTPSFEQLPKADQNLLIAAADADLSGMKKALESGARPHFWSYDAQNLKNTSPASALLKYEKDDPDLKIAGLNLLHQHGFSYCEASEDQHASVMGALELRNRPREYHRLVEWFLDKEIGLSIEEGVGHWLKDALSDFKHDHAARALSYLSKDLAGKKTPELFPMILSAALPNAIGASILKLTRSPLSEDEAEIIRNFLSVMKGAWHRLMEGNALLKKSQTESQEFLFSFAVVDLSNAYPDRDRFERSFFIMHDYMKSLYPDMERREWELYLDQHERENVVSFEQDRKKWGIALMRTMLADQEAHMISTQTLPLKNSAPKNRL